MSFIKDIRRDVNRDVKAAMKLHPPPWSVLCVFIAVLFAYPLIDSAGKVQLVIPIVASATVLGVTLVIKRQLKRFAWFWITMVFLAALHIILILYVPWTSNWVPAVVSVAVASVDGIIVLAIVDAVARLTRATK